MATQQEILEVLRRARERIADPARWCRGTLAVDAEGVACDARSAVAWCAVGALYVGGDREGAPAFGFLDKAAWLGWGRRPTDLNDTLSHAAVLALYDRAIADAEAAVLA